MSALTVSNEREVQPYELPLEQLSNLKTQHEEELQELQRQMESIFGAKTRFMNAKQSLLDLSSNPNDTKLLIPLNASLYVPGRIVDADKVSQSVSQHSINRQNIATTCPFYHARQHAHIFVIAPSVNSALLC